MHARCGPQGTVRDRLGTLVAALHEAKTLHTIRTAVKAPGQSRLTDCAWGSSSHQPQCNKSSRGRLRATPSTSLPQSQPRQDPVRCPHLLSVR